MVRMPKEHLDARRRQILDAARRCFVRNGFHATSMQDVLAEAGLSVGAVYRYFRSKDDIIAAIASEALDEVAKVIDTPQLPDLDSIVDLVLSAGRPPLDGSRESACLLVQVWAEALRSPTLGARLQSVMDGTRDMLTSLVARGQRQGHLPTDVPPEHVASVLLALVDGFMVQRAVRGNADPAAFREGMRALMVPSDRGVP